MLAWIGANVALIGQYTWAHLWLTLLSTAVGVLLSLPLGYLAYRWHRAHLFIVGGTSLFYTVPSLALFILLPRMLGTRILDPVNVVVALVIYTMALMVRVVADGLASVPASVSDAARGLGYSGLQRLLQVELPLAIPALVSGLRVVMVSNISIVTVAAIIGIPQLGTFFTMGFTRRLFLPIVIGLLLCLLLALVLDWLLVTLGQWLAPWQRREGL